MRRGHAADARRRLDYSAAFDSQCSGDWTRLRRRIDSPAVASGARKTRREDEHAAWERRRQVGPWEGRARKILEFARFSFIRRPQATPSAPGLAWDRRTQFWPNPALFGPLGSRLGDFSPSDASSAVLGARLEML